MGKCRDYATIGRRSRIRWRLLKSCHLDGRGWIAERATQRYHEAWSALPGVTFQGN
jgi:hypothetical protein